jgi:hypothetical protein
MDVAARTSSGRLCEETLRAFDRLCELERDGDGAATGLTPRQKHRRQLLETRTHAQEWLVPPQIAETIEALIATADRIDDPALARLWTDHLPVAVLACLERRSLARRLLERDPLVVPA